MLTGIPFVFPNEDEVFAIYAGNGLNHWICLIRPDPQKVCIMIRLICYPKATYPRNLVFLQGSGEFFPEVYQILGSNPALTKIQVIVVRSLMKIDIYRHPKGAGL